MKINFERVEVFEDVAHSRCRVVSIRKELADFIYTNGRGIAAHALALKIYNSKGEEEYDESECGMILEVAKFGTPALIDAINTLLCDGNGA